MANKYSKGKSFLGDHTNIYDDNGQKVGEQRESFWGDHTNIYDKNGNKIGEKRESFWDGHTNYYDANGKKSERNVNPSLEITRIFIMPKERKSDGLTTRFLVREGNITSMNR